MGEKLKTLYSVYRWRKPWIKLSRSAAKEDMEPSRKHARRH